MLKGLDPLLNADLLYVLAAMGHGDEIAVVDNNFPATSHAARLIRLDAADILAAGRAILGVFPLDTFVDAPVVRMEEVDDAAAVPPVQAEFLALCESLEGRPVTMASVSRSAFYERARSAFAIVATGETRGYGCFLLVKGLVR
jgi:L-fucose mutarotase